MNLSDYFEAVYDSCKARESENGNPVDCFFSVGHHVIQLHFADAAFATPLLPAFQHLITKPKIPADLTVYLWESAGEGSKMPPSPSWNDNNSFCPSFLSNDCFFLACDLWPHRLSMFDKLQNRALYWINNAEEIPWWEKGAPLKFILSWWASCHGMQLIHAAAVGIASGGVLLGGKGGSGKSTAALACLDSQLCYVGDDYCIITTDSSPCICSTYGTAKLKEAKDTESFPHLKPLVINATRLDKEKPMIFLYKNYRAKMINSFPLKAILLTRITGKKETTLKKADWQQALKEIFYFTVKQRRDVSVSDFYAVCRAAKQVPSYFLELGTDLSKIPKVILDLLSGN